MEIDLYYKDDKQYFLFSLKVPDNEKKRREVLNKIQELNDVDGVDIKILDVKSWSDNIRVDVLVPVYEKLLISIVTDLKRAETSAWRA